MTGRALLCSMFGHRVTTDHRGRHICSRCAHRFRYVTPDEHAHSLRLRAKGIR